MASRLNVSHQTFGQLVRFALVGLFLAAVYSAIYWYLATYVMPPVAAVVIAFLVSVTIGFALHPQRGLHLGPDRADARADLVAADPGHLRHSDRNVRAQPAMGIQLTRTSALCSNAAVG
jgi:hypothetical protein